jgi:hypothetical protein
LTLLAFVAAEAATPEVLPISRNLQSHGNLKTRVATLTLKRVLISWALCPEDTDRGYQGLCVRQSLPGSGLCCLFVATLRAFQLETGPSNF